MNITEKSKEYAKGKAMDAISAAIEQAYADGYNDGMQHRENEMLEAVKDGVQYVDLHLPSGKMWSSTYIIDKKYKVPKVLGYIDASKLDIPSKEDFDELFSYCERDYYLHTSVKGIVFTGRNANKIVIPYYKIENHETISDNLGESFKFWLRDDEEYPAKNYAYNLTSKGIIEGRLGKIYMGYKLPIMLVKQK